MLLSAGYVSLINKARSKVRPCSPPYLSGTLFLQTYKATATANQSVQERERRMPLCMNWGQSGIAQMAQWNTSCSIVSHRALSFTMGHGTHPATQEHKSCHFVWLIMWHAQPSKPRLAVSTFQSHYQAEIEHFNVIYSYKGTQRIHHTLITVVTFHICSFCSVDKHLKPGWLQKG